MAKQDDTLTLIRDIHPFQSPFRTRVRVARTWRPKKYGDNAYDGFHYLLVDEKGDTIHAIVDEDTYPYMAEKMEQGNIYDIYRFHVKMDYSKLRISNTDVQLTFTQYTKFVLINETSPVIPRLAFRLLEFEEFAAEVSKQTVLADVYGCIKSVIPDHQVFVRDKNQMELICEFTIENLRREQLKICFWGDLGKRHDMMALEQMSPPVFAVFTSLRVTTFKREITATATRHTCVIFSPAVADADKYKAEFSKLGDKVKISRSREVLEDTRQAGKMRTVSQLHELNPEKHSKEIVFCKATIQRFATFGGWWYNRCPIAGCYRQLKEKEGTKQYTCVLHGVQDPYPYYRLRMTIHDNDDQAIVTIMGNPADELFGCSCRDLLEGPYYEGGQVLPELITQVQGQTHLFEIKVNTNGDLMVRRIVMDPKISKSMLDKEPTSHTPEKMIERKRPAETVAGRALFGYDSNQQSKRQAKESASSSAAP